MITNETALPILMLADKYDVGALSRECVDYMHCHYAAFPQHLKV
jgi:hypothetical protein